MLGLVSLPLLFLSALAHACNLPIIDEFADDSRRNMLISEEMIYFVNENSKLGSASVVSRYESEEVQHRLYLRSRSDFLKQLWDVVSVEEVRKGDALQAPLTITRGGFISNIPVLITRPDGNVAPAFPKWQTNVAEQFVLEGYNAKKADNAIGRSTHNLVQNLKEAGEKIYRYYYQKLAQRPVARAIRFPRTLATVKLPQHFSDYSCPPLASAWRVTDVIRFVTLAAKNAEELESHMRALFHDFVKLETRKFPKVLFLIAPFEFVEGGQPEAFFPISCLSMPEIERLVMTTIRIRSMLIGYTTEKVTMLRFKDTAPTYNPARNDRNARIKTKLLVSRLSCSLPLPVNCTEAEMLDALRQASDRLIQPSSPKL